MQIAGLVITLSFIIMIVISPSKADIDPEDCYTDFEGMLHTIINIKCSYTCMHALYINIKSINTCILNIPSSYY